MKNALKQLGISAIFLITPLLSISQANAQSAQLAPSNIRLQSQVKLTPACRPDFPDGCVGPIRIPDFEPLRCDPRFCDPSPLYDLRIPRDVLIVPKDRIRNIEQVIQKEPVRQIENLDRFRQGNAPGLKELYDD